jgi:16S rRNA (guanine527-N7)-methyltransferase
METSRIAALLGPFLDDASLSPDQLDQISTYIDLVLRWNSRVNLTAIRTPDEIVTRHFGESFFAARHLFPRGVVNIRSAPSTATPGAQNPIVTPAAGPLLDIGSGAGFPGLPIKIWSLHTHVTLIESNNKKVAFLREAIRALGLTDINVSATRAEDLPDSLAATVTLRAVERFNQILPTAVRLLVSSGHLALLIGHPQLQETTHLNPTITWHNPTPIPGTKSRILVVGRKARK